jgi:hypothetical protein
MQSAYNCPGEPVLQSDTIDNQLPEVAPLRSVSVVNGNVELIWSPSPSPEVNAYIIYRLIGGNVDPIDTVFAGTSYTDVNANPGGQSEQYYVLGLDPCGNTSIFLNPHQTIFAEASFDSCARTIQLDWNLYQNWPGGIGRQEIWVSQDGAPAQPVDTVNGTAESYIYNIPNDNTQYCIYVQAVEGGSEIPARSNQICINAQIVVPVETIKMQNATWRPDGNVEVSWSWNTDAEIAVYSLGRQLEGDNQVQFVDIDNPILPLSPVQQAIDIQPPAGPLTYSVATTDFCDADVISDTIRPVYLSGSALTDQVNRLMWDPLVLEGKTSLGFDLYRIVDNVPALLGQLDADTNDFEDLLDATDPGQSQACYYVIERAEVDQPDGSFSSIQARSNLLCIDQFANLLVPNAFAPRGRNQEFRPVVIFGGDRGLPNADLQPLWSGDFRKSECRRGLERTIQRPGHATGGICLSNSAHPTRRKSFGKKGNGRTFTVN